MATVKDIAEHTGYSRATISRVLNMDSSFSVSEETRQKILACAQDLQYTVKCRKEKITENGYKDYKIGIIPIGLDATDQGELQDPYYLYIRNGVESRLDEINVRNAYTIPLNQYSDYAKLDGLDGMIVIGKKKVEEKNAYFDCLKNVIFVDYAFNTKKYDCILSDFDDAMNQAFNHLEERGYQSIGYIGSWDYVNDFGNAKMIQCIDSRQTAYEEYCKKKEKNPQIHMYIGEKFTAAIGYELAADAIRSGNLPDAFVIGSDPMAIGVYRAFHDSGVHIGTDIGMISIDGNDDTNYMTPALTTVKVHAYQMGRSAVDCLKEQLEGRKIPVKVILPVELIVRESCMGKK